MRRRSRSVASREGKVGGDARPLRRDGALCHLHDDFRAGLEAFVYLLVGEPFAAALAALALLLAVAGRAQLLLVVLVVLVLVEEGLLVGRHVPVVQKGVLLQADIDERRLEVVLEVLHASLEDAADEPLVLGMFDHVLLEPTVLHHRHTRFETLHVDDDFSCQSIAPEATQ